MKPLENNLLKTLPGYRSVLTYLKQAGKQKPFMTISISILLILSAPLIIAAQATSGVTGLVTDSNNALVAGAEVKLTDTKTSRELTTKTNDDGTYKFTNVQPGSGYKITFTASGFQTLVLNNVSLGIGKTETYNGQLNAGDVSGTVTVTTTTGEATLNTTDASIGNVISQRQLRELPIRLRDNPASLIGLQPGVIGNNVGTGATNRVGSVTGSRADQGNITVDGIDANDATTGQAFVTVGNLPIDSVQEFRAVTTNPNASEGRSSGGQIQLATKSGANDFHGSLREFYRTDRTSANSFFNNKNGIARPKLQRHQFGGSLSGPVPIPNFGENSGPMFRSGKDRLFFFFDYEGRRDNSEVTVTRTVPLQNFREGRIGYVNNNPGCNSSSRLDTAPTCISFLTPAQTAALDPRGTGVNQALLSFINSRYPAANDLTGGNGVNTGLFRFNAPNLLSNNTYTSRIDWNITKTQTMFGRLTLTRNDQTNGAELFPGDGDSEKLIDKSYQFVVGHTWAVTSSFTNQAIVGISKQKWDFPVPQSAAYPNIFSFGPLENPFADISFQNRYVTVPTFRDDVTWIKGNHTIQFGGTFRPVQQKTTLVSDFNSVALGIGGNLTQLNSTFRPVNIFTGTGATGNFDSAFTFLLGRISTLGTNYVYDTQGTVQPLGTGKTRDFVYNEFEPYIQDNWKIRSDLTINLGLHWYLYPAPYEKNGFQAANDVDFQTLIDKRIANGAAGISGPNASPILSIDLIGKANNGRPYYKTDYNNFGPHVGFAYNPSLKNGLLGGIFGDRKTVIRGGFNKQYDRVAGAVTFIQDQFSYIFDNTANSQFGGLTVGGSLLTDPRFTGISSLPVQNTAPTITRPFTPDPEGLSSGVYNYAVAQNFKIPYSYQWSLGFQRDIPGNLILDVSYVGRKARRLFAQSDASQIVDFKDPASGQFMIAAFNAVQSQLQSGSVITAQPWVENQVAPLAASNYGRTCKKVGEDFLGFSPANCTQLIAGFIPSLLEQGGAADVVTTLFNNGLLNHNVGLAPQFAVNSYITNQGFSDYHAMLISLRKRFSKGLQFDVNYSWSHAIDNQSNVTNAVSEGLVFDALNTNAGRGNADFDIRHLFNANAIWDIPLGRGRYLGNRMPKWLDAVIGGWTLAGVISARSGLPATSYSFAWSVTEFTGANAGVPSVINGDTAVFKSKISDEGTGIQYFADADAVQNALRYPKHGEVGNRNIFRSPGYFEINTVLSKKFKMPWSESHVLTLRAEAYNLTNSNFFSSPNLDFNSSTFGRITTSQSSPREFQFALRYDF